MERSTREKVKAAGVLFLETDGEVEVDHEMTRLRSTSVNAKFDTGTSLARRLHKICFQFLCGSLEGNTK